MFFLFGSSPISAQKTAHLHILGIENILRKKSLTFTDSMSLQKIMADLQFSGYKKGYWTFSIDSLLKTDSLNYVVYGNVGNKISLINVSISEENKKIMRSLGISWKSFTTNKPNPFTITSNLENILLKLENSGYPFAKVGFKTLEQKGTELSTQLVIEKNQRFKWTKIEIIGKNSKISPKFVANYLHIEEGTWFQQDALQLIPVRMKQLTYLKQTKPAELLFSNDGATVYLYIESKPVSSFNGTVGLQQNPVTKSYQLTGDLRLKLQNAFKKGELFELNWRSIQPGSPQLKTQVSYPYLFNTPFGIDGQFQLFKRDSTFLELKSSIGVNYFLSAGNTLKGFYKNQQSSVLGNTATANLANVKSNQYGLSITHQTIDYLPNPRKGFLWFVETSAGNRTVSKDTISTTSLLISGKITLEWYIPLGKKFVLKTAINSETYSSANIQQNELLRFGGNLNQRGFLEDELLGTTKATGTIEARFILDQNSFMFAFYDQSWYERNTMTYLNDTPRGFGAGLSFGTEIGIFSLTYALGKQFDNPVLFRDSKIHFGYIAFF